ncbi:MAG TPA: hypothetical protein VFE05_07080 [Longimicrobiaceae bacterium]|jgi:hypothetical protein|nr:hypothetical protein [Longimicrobiaceae bacterium]
MAAKKRPRRVWARSGSPADKPKIPDVLKARAQTEADTLLEHFRPLHIRPEENPQFNYITELSSVWFRGYLYLRAIYANVYPHGDPTFEVRFTRLEYAGGEKFNLAYMRHTGQWWEVYHDLPLEDAIRTIREEIIFHP